MPQIAVKVDDEHKAGLLIELLSAMDFVDDIQVNGFDIHSHVQSIYQDPRQPLMENEVAAFEKLHPMLVEHYLGEFVAVHQGQVVDHDNDQIALVDRVESAYPDKVVLIRKVQEQLPPPLVFRSPRLERD
jgi:hypothetical protein